jgi:hypothetical protein
MEWSLGLKHQFGSSTSVQAQYVGTRAVNQPYLTKVNGHQTSVRYDGLPGEQSRLAHVLSTTQALDARDDAIGRSRPL